LETKLLERIKEQLVRHEGLRLKPYRCTAGKLTNGIDRNLDFCSTQMTQIERIYADYNRFDSNHIPVSPRYFHPAGLDRLNQLKPRRPRPIRVGVI